jgi:hypothetical protein
MQSLSFVQTQHLRVAPWVTGYWEVIAELPAKSGFRQVRQADPAWRSNLPLTPFVALLRMDALYPLAHSNQYVSSISALPWNRQSTKTRLWNYQERVRRLAALDSSECQQFFADSCAHFEHSANDGVISEERLRSEVETTRPELLRLHSGEGREPEVLHGLRLRATR